MERDTSMGGAQRPLPETRHSVIQQAASPDTVERERAWEVIASIYWRPVYKYLRTHWKKSNEDAKDLTQAFFARALEKDFFEGFDAGQAKFRTFLRVCVDRFAKNDDRAHRALKRGGGAEKLLDLDFVEAEHELALASPSGHATEDAFHQEWVRSVFSAAVDDLRQLLHAQGKEQVFEIFRRYDLEGTSPGVPRLTYDQVARELGIDAVTLTNRLGLARRELRKIVLAKVRALTGSDEEYRDEVRVVLGIDVP